MQSFIFIHLNNEFVRIDLKDIQYVVSVAHHIKIFTDKGNFMPHLSLKQLEAMLPMGLFSRVNRGTLVPLQRIISFDKETVFLKEAKFSFTDKYRKEFIEKVTVLIHQEKRSVKKQEKDVFVAFSDSTPTPNIE